MARSSLSNLGLSNRGAKCLIENTDDGQHQSYSLLTQNGHIGQLAQLQTLQSSQGQELLHQGTMVFHPVEGKESNWGNSI